MFKIIEYVNRVLLRDIKEIPENELAPKELNIYKKILKDATDNAKILEKYNTSNLRVYNEK